MKKLIIFGDTVVAKLAHFYFSRDSGYTVEGFTLDAEYINQPDFCDLTIFEFEAICESHPPEEYEMFVAIGPSKMNSIREMKIKEAREKGYTLASYQSPSAICHSDYGENTLIADHAVINPFSVIGEGGCFWEYALISNDSEIGDYCYFSPRCILSSYCNVANNSVLGSGAIVKARVNIAYKTLVGAGCFLSKDSTDYAVYGLRSAESLGNVSEKISSWT